MCEKGERKVHPGGPIFSLPEIIADIQRSADDPAPDGRTRILTSTKDVEIIVSGYRPNDGEEYHVHPTTNTLEVLDGTFRLSILDENKVEHHFLFETGMMITLDRFQPHRVQALVQDRLSIVKVTIIEGMPTSTPGYSTPYQASASV